MLSYNKLTEEQEKTISCLAKRHNKKVEDLSTAKVGFEIVGNFTSCIIRHQRKDYSGVSKLNMKDVEFARVDVCHGKKLNEKTGKQENHYKKERKVRNYLSSSIGKEIAFNKAVRNLLGITIKRNSGEFKISELKREDFATI